MIRAGGRRRRGEPGSRLTGAAAALCAVVVLTAAGCAATNPQDTSRQDGPRPSTAGPSVASRDVPPSPSSTPSELATAHATLDDLRRQAATRPVAVTVPGYPGSAPVVQRTTNPVGGGLDLPPDPREVAWWSAGAQPGDGHGDVVLASHISYNGRYGPFTRLAALHPGQTVSVRTAGGQQRHYRITGIRQVAKGGFDRQGLFRADGPPRLILVTCGGRYDPTTHNYADNVVVTAVPIA